MEKHKRTLGILLICYAIIKVVLYIFGLQIMTVALNYISDESEILFAAHLAKYIIGTLIVMYAVPSVIAGMGLLSGKKWALILALVIGIISLPVFPLGTALGIYAIIVFLMDQSKIYNPDRIITTTETPQPPETSSQSSETQ